ncbi:MAG: hypothetical protein JSU98_12565 [Gemmatimonadales bacterium]|nr:MAG: hypothetical protein JSU98_12565 [Gemmatimonadales bacterium]
MSTLSNRRLSFVLMGLVVLPFVGCWGDDNPSAPELSDEEEPPVPAAIGTEAAGWLVRCRVDADPIEFTCQDPDAPHSVDAQTVVIGGQDQYVTLANDAVEFSGGTLTAQVWVENLIPQPLGTPDGTTPTGIRVFFHSTPTNGVTIGNADGTGTFTGSGQKFFEYARIAQALDRTVRRPWEFVLPEGVTTFTFEVYVDAEVPFPNGWVEITPGSDGLAEAENVQLSAQAYNVVGEEVPGRTFTWVASDSDVVSVTSSGLATGEAAGGPVTVTATSNGPETAGQAVFTVGGNDISVLVGTTPDAVDEGAVLSHVVAVENNGPTPITDAEVWLEVRGTVLRSSSQCGFLVLTEPGNQVYICNTGPLVDGGTTGFLIDVQVTSTETVTSVATLEKINGGDDLSSDPNPQNNTFTAITIVEDIPDSDLSIAVSDTPDPVFVDGEITYVVTASNLGAEDATGVTVDLRVDANGDAEFTSFTPPPGCELFNSGSAGSFDKLFRCDLGSVPAGGSADSPALSITPGANLIGQSLAATADFYRTKGVYDPTTSNNSATISTGVIDGPDLTVSALEFTPAEAFDTDNVFIEATVANQGGVSTEASFDWAISVDGSPIASGTESALGPGASVVISSGSLGPYAAGEHSVEVVVDVLDAVAEKDETDNALSSILLVQEPGFQIELVYVGSFTPSQQSVINAAAARWESIIAGDLSGEYVDFFEANPYCPNNFEGSVDDVVVFVDTTDHSSGVGGVLAFAGPWLLRSTELTICGRMVFDINDLANLESQGRLEAVAGHELAHVLGVGTIWGDNPFIPNDPVDLLAGVGTTDPYFIGTEAIAQFDDAGGTSYTRGNKVPVQDESGYGHWREGVLDTELMTPFLEVPGIPNEWSLITAGALQDMGYQVNLESVEIDPFTLDLAGAAAALFTESGLTDIVQQPRAIRLPDGRTILLGG